MKRYLLILIIILVEIPAGRALAADYQLWTDFVSIYKINDIWRYNGDYGIRNGIKGYDWDQIYIRPSVRYVWKPHVHLHGGLGLFQTFEGGHTSLFEIRPWQGVNILWPRLRGFNFANFFRLEERISYVNGTSEWDFGLRGRYRLRVTTPLFGIFESRKLNYASASIEFFANIVEISEYEITRSRIDLGYGRHIAERWRLELHYILQGAKAGRGLNFDADAHIFRLRFFYTIN
jgi:hypothetical protein